MNEAIRKGVKQWEGGAGEYMWPLVLVEINLRGLETLAFTNRKFCKAAGCSKK
jgi:hypothetical protein